MIHERRSGGVGRRDVSLTSTAGRRFCSGLFYPIARRPDRIIERTSGGVLVAIAILGVWGGARIRGERKRARVLIVRFP